MYTTSPIDQYLAAMFSNGQKSSLAKAAAILIVCFSLCDSFTNVFPATLSRGFASRTIRSVSLNAASKPLVDLSIDDIAARWKVIKFGQGSGASNGIELADRELSVRTVKIPMSRVGGLGLDLMEYNVGKGNLGLVLVGGVIEGSNAEKCGLFLPGDALEAITSISAGVYSISSLIISSLITILSTHFINRLFYQMERLHLSPD